MPPLASGIWNGWMAFPTGKNLSATVAPPNDGAVSAATSTSISAVSRLASPAWAAASTRTLSLTSSASVVPLQERVRVAVVLPAAPPVTLATVRPATAGLAASSKLAAPTPLANVVRSSATVTWAPFRVAAVRMLGEAMAAAGVSSSFTVTATAGRVGTPKKPPPHTPPTRRWLMAAVSSTPSASPAAVTVTVCAVLQSLPSNMSRFVRGDVSVSRVTSGLSLTASMVTLQPPPAAVVGSAASARV